MALPISPVDNAPSEFASSASITGSTGRVRIVLEVLAAWKAITTAADSWLETLTPTKLLEHPVVNGKTIARLHGNMLQRVIYHYWYHTGENLAIRQQLGHKRLPQFVGAIDSKASYRPESKTDK